MTSASGLFRPRTGGGGAATVLRAGRFDVPPGWRLPLRITEFHVLFVGTAGRLRFDTGGAERLLVPGTALWLPRHRAHEGTAPYPVDSGCYVVHFTLPPRDEPSLTTARPWQLTGADAERLWGRCAAVVDQLAQESASADHRADAELNLLLADLLGQPTGPDPVPTRTVPATRSGDIARVLDHIATHTEQPLPVTELAGVAGLQRGHFSLVFKQLTGLSPSQYVVAARIARARELLEHGESLEHRDLTLDTIAARCGFSSASHLTRRFKELEGMAPGTYRDRHATSQNQLGLPQRAPTGPVR